MKRRLGRAAMAIALSSIGIVVLAEPVAAQQPTPPPRGQTQRRPETIEIRGQVPTPQVVTVRPREAPAYSRRVLVPAFFDRSFWPSILPPLQLIGPTAPATADTSSRAAADSASRSQPAPRTPSGTPPAPLRP